MLPGVELMAAGVMPEPDFARDFGLFLRELHSLPVEQALALGVPLLDGPSLRRERGEHYEDVIRRCFPLISCEARVYVQQIYELYLNDPANFEFRPCLVHGDLDSNTLIDPASGRLTGVIDFGELSASSRAHDFWAPVFCFPRLGIASQLEECFEAAGLLCE
jgi:aminoglycoside 2''-phosphotransferase